ncbi:hypothetical protein B0T17DRAFT_543876 [Bombardia bombarda]|uniref:Uncharacterized protein n=1 Tax=Bombardia bombarda TaxID=252184 RepID=A0AA39WAR5_9PEZI|nr:hypothetical protein B0T17DRAFT_543876 [Bombardia bombarda]
MGGGPNPPPAASPADKLPGLLTPSLLALIVSRRLPYSPPTAPINFAHFGRDIFLTDSFGPLIRSHVWPVLIALSEIGLSRMPDLSSPPYLPHPADPSYPAQCLGLQLLLDHLPRLLFRGVDHRWTYDYFNILSERLASTWLALPEHQRPDSWARWRDGDGNGDGNGAGLDYWIGVRFWFGTPFVHSERLASQESAAEYTEATRRVVEDISGLTDPYREREKREAILSDVVGFPREYRRGPPQGDGVTRESWTFWMGMLMDIHKPIIDKFGRYPYLNAICGRKATEEEKRWVEETDHFGEAAEDVATWIRDDVNAGRWSRLGTGTKV